MLTLIERSTRYARLADLPNGYDSTEVLAALVEVFETISSHLRLSLTLDQGSEWAQWDTLAVTYGLDVWFCDPHSPWQRGAIECFNGDVRFWFPKSTRLDNVGVERVETAQEVLNNQRRRILDWRTPTELFNQATILRL